MNIRKAIPADLPVLLALYEKARTFMAAHGNPTQWGNAYPPVSLLESDIHAKNCYVCEEHGNIIAVFYYHLGPDPTYTHIYNGQWLNTSPYGVGHRITADGTIKGTASFCLDWAWKQCKNLKIDTHRNNHIMQHLLCKNGFTYCGIIYLEDGSERLAYQKNEAVR